MRENKESIVVISEQDMLTVTRVYDARREDVFAAWIDPQSLKNWWRPKGFGWVEGTMDLRPGGMFHICLRAKDGYEVWSKSVYREIVEPERLAFIISFSDPYGNSQRHPASPSWPLEILNTVTLSDRAGRTELMLQAVPINATEEEHKIFEDAHEAVHNLLDSILDQLDTFLKSTKRGNVIAGDKPQSGEIVITRVIDAPSHLVWEAWIKPEYIMRWLGPRNYLFPFLKIDFHAGGSYLFHMRSPEHRDVWITGEYRAIEPMRRFVCTFSFADKEGVVIPASHFGWSADIPMISTITVTFEGLENASPGRTGKTKIVLQHAGLPAGWMNELTEAVWNDSIDTLVELLNHVDGNVIPLEGKNIRALSVPPDREIGRVRVFDAPREEVFRAFTDPQRIPFWWGPKDLPTTVDLMDVRQGGRWRFHQKGSRYEVYTFSGVYREIIPSERLVYTYEYEGMPGLIIVETVTFEEHDGLHGDNKRKTCMTIRSLFSSVEDRDEILAAGMESGGLGPLDRLADYLEGV